MSHFRFQFQNCKFSAGFLFVCFFPSQAWKLVAFSTLRLAAVNSAGNKLLFLGKYLVTSVTLCVAIFIFKYDPNLRLSASSTLAVGVFTYFVAHSVISLYEVSDRGTWNFKQARIRHFVPLKIICI